MKINSKIFTVCATLALSSLSYSVFAVEHNHGRYTYEPVEENGVIINCPCEIMNDDIRFHSFAMQEFSKQEEIQDLLREQGKNPKPRSYDKKIKEEPVVENGLPESGRVFYDMDDIFMQTTNKEEFEDFFKRYVSRKYTCNEVASLNFATPQNGDLKILVGIDGTPSIISRNMNVNSMLGIKVGSTTWKFVQVPVRVEGYQFVNNRWIPIGAIKVLSEQTIKDDPRKIYKNAMNDSINYFTSPEDRITRALFESGIKHRSVFDHMSNW